MDRFLLRGAPKKTPGRKTKRKAGEPAEDPNSPPEGGRETEEKKLRQDLVPLNEAASAGLPWKQIRAEGLDCDYTILFGKAEADRLFQQLEKEVEYLDEEETRLLVFGRWHQIPRKQATYGDPGLTYTYSGVTFSPKAWLPVLDRIRDRVRVATGHSFNFVLINRYKDGRDRMGEHRDDEKELVPGSPIASASFGARRDFVFRHGASRRQGPSHRPAPVKLALDHGSLLVMNFPTNRHWYHSLPPRKRVLAPRVNLTFRQVMAVPPGRRGGRGPPSLSDPDPASASSGCLASTQADHNRHGMV